MNTKSSQAKSNSTQTVAVIASTMRSGSTLLKALLATADDISDLPETNFQKRRFQNPESIWQLDSRPIVVLKRPAWYHEVNRYPQLPAIAGLKTILLVRDVYPTVVSLQKMTFRSWHRWSTRRFKAWLVQKYWGGITGNLLNLKAKLGTRAQLVRYEDLVENPTDTTAQLFQFLDSSQRQGVSRYLQPENYKWRWGIDDGGTKIKSLQVQRPRPLQYHDGELVELIRRCDAVQALRGSLGYPELSHDTRGESPSGRQLQTDQPRD